METRTPRWVRAEDVRVAVDARGIAVDVAGVMEGLTRTFWRPAEAAMRPAATRNILFVVPEETAWSLDRDDVARGDPNRDGDEDTATVTICMVKRAATEDEVMYKRGEVQDNGHASSPANPAGKPGWTLRRGPGRFRTRGRARRGVFLRDGTRVATGETVVRARTGHRGTRGMGRGRGSVGRERFVGGIAARSEQLLALDEDDDAKIMSSRG